MSSRVILAVLCLAALISMSFSDYAYTQNSYQKYSSSKSSGINLLPSGFEFQYSNDADFQNYGLLSSYSCCDTVNRPSDLWIIDGMLNKEQHCLLYTSPSPRD